MNKLEVLNKINIKDKIHQIRGKLVILGSDLGKLYEFANGTKDINKAVKRNKERFPEEFCFQLSDDEFKIWKSQTVISKTEKMSLRKNPYAFTEQGDRKSVV